MSVAIHVDPYRELFERSADPILIIEEDAFVDCNQAAADMLGYGSREEVLRLHPWQISPPRQANGEDSAELGRQYLDIAFEKGSHRFEWLHVTSTGETFPVEVLLTAVMENDRRTLHVVWRDLSERRRLEESLRRAQKMDAMGKLAGGIAHDFNNYLVVIMGNSEFLSDRVAADPDARECLDQIVASAERGADLVRQLLAFGSRHRLDGELIDVRHLVDELRPLMDRLVGEGVSFAIDHTLDPLPVKVDRGKVEQILMNLTSNGRDAMAGGGQLRIETKRVELAPGDVTNALDVPPGSYARIAVSDSGTGMTPEVAQKAFDPFFTTKGAHGTGLGLATCYGIARQSGGTLEVQSEVGVGTVMSVYLPIHAD